MNREEAIAIIRKEYLCVDRDCDIERNCGKCDLMMPSKEPILEAYKIAIKALEQEPCEDAIDRKLVCAFIAGLISDDVEREKGLEYIRNMPPVNPQPCEDAISRQAVIDSLHSKFADGFDSDRWWNSKSVLYAINKVPPVNPQEPKTDSWSIKDVVDTFKKHGLIREQEPCSDAISRENAIIRISWDFPTLEISKVKESLDKLPSVNPQPKTGHCKDCKWWKDSDGTYCRGVHAESKCSINRKEVYEGNGYCYMFKPQERSDER